MALTLNCRGIDTNKCFGLYYFAYDSFINYYKEWHYNELSFSGAVLICQNDIHACYSF